MCVEIGPGGCTLGDTTQTTVLNTESTMTQNPESTTMSSTTSIDSTTPEICPPGSFGTRPHPERCDAFYMCAAGNAIKLFCSEGFEYDDVAGVRIDS